MAHCSFCNKLMVGGYRSGEERFCSLACYTASPGRTFCPDCLNATTAESPGGTFTFNSVGTHLYFASDRCPKCHSIVQLKAACILFLPVIPLGRYRMIYLGNNRYIGRRLHPHAASAATSSFPPIHPK